MSEAKDIDVEYVLDGDTWTLDIQLGKTSMIIEADLNEPDSLATLVGSLTQILNQAWDAVEAEIESNKQEAP